tara:strand:- start:671 stop:2548 length:1878 start_codon:yes stop_codon:yes gene_type:complete
MITNEVFIDTATLRENIVSLARNIGYVPRPRQSARATISFFVNTSGIVPSPATLTLKKGPVAASSAAFGGQSFVFSILSDITVPVFNGIAEFNNVEVFEGTLLTQTFTFSSRIPNQKFILPNIGVDTDLITVSVRPNEASTTETKYSVQNSLFDVNSDSKVYYLQEIEDERYQIFFGDGIFGKELEDGNFITINYITSAGDAANGLSSFNFAGRIQYTRNAQTFTISSGISLMTTGLSASGGETIESVESVRKFAPRIYSSQNRAVTANDYESLIPSRIYPETESISVFGGEDLIPPQFGKVFISIKPRTGDFLPNLIKEKIKLKLKKFAVAGIVPEILDLKYLYIEVDSKVYYNTNLAPDAATVSTLVQNNAEKFAESSDMNKYGARFKYSKFLNIIDQSNESVTSNITKIFIRRDIRAVLNAFAEYQIGFGNEFYIKSMSGYNIKSSAFRIAGVMDDVYISDIPNTNKLTGSLFLFSLPSIESESPTIIKRNVGTIDYKNGIITINPINIQSGMIKDGQTIIEISVCPLSNDVIGLQDLYLQLDISNSTFETVVDEIASGLDPSGSNYITSSSYANGNLVRAGGRNSDITTTSGSSVPSTSSSVTTAGTSTVSSTSTSGASSY